jgi:hypothetical protein
LLMFRTRRLQVSSDSGAISFDRCRISIHSFLKLLLSFSTGSCSKSIKKHKSYSSEKEFPTRRESLVPGALLNTHLAFNRSRVWKIILPAAIPSAEGLDRIRILQSFRMRSRILSEIDLRSSSSLFRGFI